MSNNFFRLILLIVFLSSCGGSSKNEPSPNIQIGDYHEGGIVFYIDESGEHGLVASVSNIGSFKWEPTSWGASSWNNYTYILGTEIFFGFGESNTDNIISQLPISNVQQSAAAKANQHQFSGFNDWYLPSKEELELMYYHLNDENTFSNGEYWTSSQYDINAVWTYMVNLSNNTGGNYKSKGENAIVRPIRSF